MGFFKQTEKTLDQKNFSFSLICCCVKDLLCKTDFLLPYLERELLLNGIEKTKPFWMSGSDGTGPCKLHIIVQSMPNLWPDQASML